ncbi:CrcB family protein [Leucobacter chromiireducens]|uniref:CrcB family protein n=1 Tax=Leucobacter chromiireducens TaxID=283877 RepID=UPI000F62CE33|nr:CrcB family protein [Leucobacter chromiireducens]
MTAVTHGARPGLAAFGLVALGGALGSIARFGAGEWLGERGGWPIGTLAVNLLGALLLGLLVELAGGSPRWRRAQLLLGTGVLGGFTTYSLLAAQLAERLLAGELGVALGYAAVTVGGGLAASLAGIAGGRALRAGSSRGSAA